MLKSLTLDYFQCHQHLCLEFSPGVNVIAGTSDIGKSAILKAILWLMTNKPQGLDFRSWGCNKGDTVEVCAVLDDRTIRRCRNETQNEYWLDDQRFVAMKGEVPTDISKFLDMQPVNIQTQFQPHFLLTNSSAEVARTLNEACDLSIIDRVVKTINSMASQAKADAQAYARQADDLTEKLRGLEWVDKAEECLVTIEAEDARIRERRNKAETLRKLISQLDQVISQIDRARSSLLLQDAVDKLAGELMKLEAARKQERELSDLVSSLQDIRTNEAIWRKQVVCSSQDLKTMEKLLAQRDALSSKIGELRQLIRDGRVLQLKLKEYEEKETELDQAISDLWESVDVCPLCGQELNHAHQN